MMKSPLILHLGSNIEDRLSFLDKAIDQLTQEFDGPIKVSSVYETKAWGIENQADFLNVAVSFLSNKNPYEILATVKEIENKLGRKIRNHWHEREIDIDLIFYGDSIVNDEKLIIPHKMMHLRKFVLVPLNDICPTFIHPVLKRTVTDLLAICNDNLEVKKWMPQ